MAVNPDTIPRYQQPMDPMPERTCGDCDHYDEMLVGLAGYKGLVGACCYERDTKGTEGELAYMEPHFMACDRWKEDA